MFGRRFREVKRKKKEVIKNFEERLAELDKPIEPATKSISIDTEIIQNHIDKCDNVISFNELVKLDKSLF